MPPCWANAAFLAMQYNVFTYIDQPTTHSLDVVILGGYRLYNLSKRDFLKQDSFTPFMANKTANGFDYGMGNPVLLIDKTGHMADEEEIIDLAEELLDENHAESASQHSEGTISAAATGTPRDSGSETTELPHGYVTPTPGTPRGEVEWQTPSAHAQVVLNNQGQVLIPREGEDDTILISAPREPDNMPMEINELTEPEPAVAVEPVIAVQPAVPAMPVQPEPQMNTYTQAEIQCLTTEPFPQAWHDAVAYYGQVYRPIARRLLPDFDRAR